MCPFNAGKCLQRTLSVWFTGCLLGLAEGYPACMYPSRNKGRRSSRVSRFRLTERLAKTAKSCAERHQNCLSQGDFQSQSLRAPKGSLGLCAGYTNMLCLRGECSSLLRSGEFRHVPVCATRFQFNTFACVLARCRHNCLHQLPLCVLCCSELMY